MEKIINNLIEIGYTPDEAKHLYKFYERSNMLDDLILYANAKTHIKYNLSALPDKPGQAVAQELT